MTSGNDFRRLCVLLVATFGSAGCTAKPDYGVPIFQVTATGTQSGYAQWNVSNLVVRNYGGTDGIVDEAGNPIDGQVPITFYASIPPGRPAGCMSDWNNQYPASLHKTVWVPIPRTGNQYAFSDVFRIVDLPNHDCVPDRIYVHFDYWPLDPTGEGNVIEGQCREGNISSVDIKGWPLTKTWTTEAPQGWEPGGCP